MTSLTASIALNRFGLGANPRDSDELGRAGRDWLLGQVRDRASFLLPARDLPTSSEAASALAEYLAIVREAMPSAFGDSAPAAPPDMTSEEQVEAVVRPLQQLNQPAQRDLAARMRHAVGTGTGFAERLVHFWSNHFTVSATKVQTIPFAGPFEREAIRPNLTGTFTDLLLAAIRHPGMLIYLDQIRSTGPNSRIGRRRDTGLNENLAREILELHTLGVHAGYTQADVTEFARALTGWTVAAQQTLRFFPQARLGDFLFVAQMHEAGAREILGTRYRQDGAEQGAAILRDLARHPATARHIANKLAAHFVADIPPPDLVARLEQVFRDSDGDLPSLHTALVEHPAAWNPEPQKFKTPVEFVVSALRLAGDTNLPPRQTLRALQAMGQVPLRAPSPAGWPDDAASWASPDALMKRIEWTQALAERAALAGRPEDLLSAALGPALSTATQQGVARAESPAQGLVLALMAPEFQRR